MLTKKCKVKSSKSTKTYPYHVVIPIAQNNITNGSAVARSSYVYVDRGKGTQKYVVI